MYTDISGICMNASLSGYNSVTFSIGFIFSYLVPTLIGTSSIVSTTTLEYANVPDYNVVFDPTYGTDTACISQVSLSLFHLHLLMFNTIWILVLKTLYLCSLIQFIMICPVFTNPGFNWMSMVIPWIYLLLSILSITLQPTCLICKLIQQMPL